MKKILSSLLLMFVPVLACSQSSWQSVFISNADEIISISKIDSNNIIAFTRNNNSCLRSSNSGTDWISYECFDTICTIWDSKFVDPKVGWCVGEYNGLSGIIFKTTDGGFNWTRKSIDTFYYGWWCLNFINSNTGWIGGFQNKILKTSDGGQNWIAQNVIPSLTDIRCINFINENTGWISGRNKFVAKTTNGGVNWVSQEINILNYGWTMSVCSVDSNNCWATGQYVDSVSALRSFVARTTNGGTNWNKIYSEVNQNSFFRILFLNSTTGFLFGNRYYIEKTTNGGQNWSIINGSMGRINSAIVKNENEMITAGGEFGVPNNFVSKTTNGGVNWIVLTSNSYLKFYDVYFSNRYDGLFVGEQNTVYRTSNGGINWMSLNLGIVSDWSSIFFTSNKTGFLFGTDGMILKTTNFGDNWSVVQTSAQTLLSSYFIGQDTGWAVGANNKILKTVDSGNNWSLQNAPYGGPLLGLHNFTSVYFKDNLTGYVIGTWFGFIPPNTTYTGSSLLKTTNGGNNWIMIDEQSGIYRKLFFLNNNTAYIAAKHKLLKSTNGGASWSLIYNNPIDFYDIDFVNAYTGYAVGVNDDGYGVILKTTNEGLNWYQQFNEYGKGVNRIFTLDTSYMWTAGLKSSIYKSTDGGGMISSVHNFENEIPQQFYLSQNYPNPFNPRTIINYSIIKSGKIDLKVFNILGELISVLVNKTQNAGDYEVEFNGSDLPSGIYFYSLSIDDIKRETKKMILIR